MLELHNRLQDGELSAVAAGALAVGAYGALELLVATMLRGTAAALCGTPSPAVTVQ